MSDGFESATAGIGEPDHDRPSGTRRAGMGLVFDGLPLPACAHALSWFFNVLAAGAQDLTPTVRRTYDESEASL